LLWVWWWDRLIARQTESLTNYGRNGLSYNPSTTMIAEQVMSAVSGVSGRHIRLTFKSEGKPSSSYKGAKLEKVTMGAFRAGIDYANLSEVKEAIAKGERGEVEPLPWGEWGVFPYSINHKGKTYFRFYPATGGIIQKPSVTYYVNGEEVDKETYQEMLPPSDRKPKDKPCFVIESNNILSIGE